MKSRALFVLVALVALCGGAAADISGGPGFTTRADKLSPSQPQTLTGLTNKGSLTETGIQVDTSAGAQNTITVTPGVTRRLQLTGALTSLGGLKCSSGADCAAGNDGWEVIIENRTGGAVTLPDQNGATTANDRFRTSGAHGLQMEAHAMCVALYSGNSSLAWRLDKCGKRIDCQIGQAEKWDGSTWQCRYPGEFAFQSGRWYGALNASSTTTAVFSATVLRCYPQFIPNALTLSSLAVEVTTIGDVGSKVRLCEYADDGTGRPGALEVDAGQGTGDATGVKVLSVSTAIQPGKHWFCEVSESVATTAPTLRTSANVVTDTDWGTATPTAGQQVAGRQMSSVTTTCPNTFVDDATTGPGTVARLMFKVQ